jgi:hypothetical protein
MRFALLLVVLAGCFDHVDERWQLDHDHVIAVRATPPRILRGERAELDALVAHDGAPTELAIPSEAAVLQGPAAIKDIVHVEDGRWYVSGPADDALVLARDELGLGEGAPVPVTVYTAYARDGADPLFAKKIVWLGEHGDNPPEPEAKVDGSPMAEDLVVPTEADVYLSVAVDPQSRVSWLSSVGTLFQDDVATSFLRVLPEDQRVGQLAVVVRAPDGGVAWRVWPLRAEPSASR